MHKQSAKMSHADAVKQIQATMQQTLPPVSFDAKNTSEIPSLPVTPLNELPVKSLIPPQIESIDTTEEEGIYVDEQEFKLAQSRVKRWLELEAEISTLNTALRERRRQKEDLNKHLIAFMQGHQVPHFEMSVGNLSLEMSKHKQPISQKWVASQIQTVSGLTHEKQEELIKVIFDERQITEKPCLKHKKSKPVKK